MPAKRLPREDRTCACGCGETFTVLPSSIRRFAPTCSTLKNPSSNLDPLVLDRVRASKIGILNPNWKPKDVRMCDCGCGKSFECLPSSKRRFLSISHSKRGDNNPMRNPKWAHLLKGHPAYPKSAKGIAAIAVAARDRMLGPSNPGRIIANATKWLKATHPNMTPSEAEFMALFGERYNLLFTGNGDLWIGGKCPDFSIPGTNIVIEVSKRILGRNEKTYTNPQLSHYARYGYSCVVVWVNRSKPYFNQVPVEELIAPALHQFQSSPLPVPTPAGS